MKLIMAVVSIQDTAELVEALSAKGLAATLVSSTGGFLRRGNDTVLLGAPDDRVAEVLDLIRVTCQPHTEGEKVRVGAATIFVLDVDQHHAF